MTYHSNDPDPTRGVRQREGMSGATVAAIAVVLALFVGTMLYAFNAGDRSTASNQAPTTTGQRTTSPTPAPTPTAPPKAQ